MPGGLRIPAIDGVRGVAVLLVLCGHVAGTGGVPMFAHASVPAELGVRVFFVLSGFLITSLLLDERAATGTVSLRGFYRRRALRIFPAAFAYLGCVALLVAARRVDTSPRDLVFAATYTMNFHADRGWDVGHLWSLSVEEQFYLCWPLVVVALAPRRAMVVAAVAIASAPAARLACWYAWPTLRPLSDQAFPCVYDALATGCLVAGLRPWLDRSPRYRALLEAAWFWPAFATCLMVVIPTRPWFALGIAPTIANVAIALAVHRCIVRPQSRAARALAVPPLVAIGRWSYSWYLWQQLFLDRHAAAWITGFPQNIALALGCALVSYYVVERPLLRWSAKLSDGSTAAEVGHRSHVVAPSPVRARSTPAAMRPCARARLTAAARRLRARA